MNAGPACVRASACDLLVGLCDFYVGVCDLHAMLPTQRLQATSGLLGKSRVAGLLQTS